MADVKIINYKKPKKEGSGGGTFIYNISNTNGLNTSKINCNEVTANHIMTEHLEANTVDSVYGNFTYLTAPEANITDINGENLNYKNGYISYLTSSNIYSDYLKSIDANIKNIYNEYLNTKEINTDYLTVNKAAHFFEVIIDKIRSISGSIMNTATSCILDYVQPLDENDELTDSVPVKYRCYWKKEDNYGNQLNNDWLVNDQAISQDCNLVSGVNHDAGNHYYWRLVTGKSERSVFVNFTTGEVSEGVPVTHDNVTTYTAPEYNIVIKKDPGISFEYENIENNEVITSYNTAWNITCNYPDKLSQDSSYITLKGDSTLNTIQLTKEANLINGTLRFETENEVKLNVGFVYDNETIEVHKSDTYKTEYEVTPVNANHNYIVAILISPDEINLFHECYWIDLSNVSGEYDEAQHLTGSFDMAPRPKDNLAQLGYRYQKLDGFENTESWRNEHKDEVSRASAQIMAAYKSPDTDVIPPSYSQYQDITDFDLSSHRGTYIDATGGYFKGRLVSQDGTIIDIDNKFDVNVEIYKIIPEKDIIVIDSNGNINPSTLNVNFLVSGNSTLSTTVPSSCSFSYKINNSNPVVIPALSQVSINISSLSEDDVIELTLFKDSKVVDNLKKTVISIEASSGENGLNAPQTQWAYKNAISINSDDYPTATNSDTYINDWISEAVPLTAQQISDEYATWRRQRTNTWTLVNNVNVKSYGGWSAAIRITGQNGQKGNDGKPGTAGKDGKYTEFIYRRFKTPPTWDNNNLNPSHWSTNDTQDYLGESYSTTNSDSPNNKWTDNPRGVNETYQYEYIATREFDGEHFGKFNTVDNVSYEPALWSKWGEKGEDGDGYEYIYYLDDIEPSNPNNISSGEVSPSGVANGSDTNKNQDDWVPNGWSDNPQGVSSAAGHTKEYVSVRKKTNGDWLSFSTPALWSQYVPQGTNGGRYQLLYANYNPTDNSTKPTIIPDGNTKYSISQLTTANWARTVSTPDFANGKYTYMIQAFFNDGQTSAVWTEPVRITGDNGKPGEDGSFTEFIYTRNNTGVAPSAPPQSGTYPRDWPNNGTTDHQTVNGITWYDNPQGVEENMQYEYVSSREYDGTTKIWSHYNTPVVWSKWGEKGQDGDGYEYIYFLYDTDSFTNPNNISSGEVSPTGVANGSDTNKNQDDWVPNGWYDEPQGVTNTSGHTKEYVSVRKKTNGDWLSFSTPALWSQYVPQGTNGGRYQLLYANYNPTDNSTKPTIIPNGSSEYSISGTNGLMSAGWARAASTPNFANGEYTYMTQAFFNDGQTAAVWTIPVRITGDNGKPGEDGTDFEFLYTRNNGKLNAQGIRIADPPYAPFYDEYGNTVNNQDDWKGIDYDNVEWTDNPQGVQADLQFEYMVQRKKLPGNSIWEDYAPSDAVVWSKWGENGRDGDGIQYIYKHFNEEQDFINDNTDNNPNNWDASSSDVYIKDNTGWTDDPQGVSQTFFYEYVSQRKYSNESGWSKYSIPKLWSRYAAQGSKGDKGAERVYLYKESSVYPSVPNSTSYYYSINSLIDTYGWGYNPTPGTGLNTYMTQAVFNEGQTDSYWSLPLQITGDKGEPGRDGDYIEFIYKHFTSEQTFGNNNYNPAYWDSSSAVDEHGNYFSYKDYTGPASIGWKDNPQGVNEIYTYEYVSQRTYTKETGFSGFTQPVIWSKWGEKGQDGDGIRYIFSNSSSIIRTIYPATSNTDYTKTNRRGEITQWRSNLSDEWNINYTGNYIPPSFTESISGKGIVCYSNWTEDPQGVDEDNTQEYVSVQRYDGETNTYSDFSTPVLWANYSVDGKEGPQGIQGPAGKDAHSYYIIPLKEDFCVKINPDDETPSSAGNYESITGSLYTDLKYVIAYIHDDILVDYLDETDISNWGFNLITDNQEKNNSFQDVGSYLHGPANTYFQYNNKDYDIGLLDFYNANLLWRTTGSTQATTYNNYYWLHQNNKVSYMPQNLSVQFTYNGEIVETREIPLVFSASHIFSVANTCLTSIYQGLTGSQGEYTKTGFSEIRQAWDNIRLGVSEINKENTGLTPTNSNVSYCLFYRKNSKTPPVKPSGIPYDNRYYRTYFVNNYWSTYDIGYLQPDSSYTYLFYSKNTRSTYFNTTTNKYEYTSWQGWTYPKIYSMYSAYLNKIEYPTEINSANLNITADEIKSEVYSTINIGNYYNKSQIDQKADEIALSVSTQVGDELKTTGIDIQTGTITLDADKTVITGYNLILEQNQGITIKNYDSFNNIIINSNDIDEFGRTNVQYIYSNNIKTPLYKYPYTGSSTTYTFLFDENNIPEMKKFNLGYMKKGSVIEFEKLGNMTWTNGAWAFYYGNDRKYGMTTNKLTIQLQRKGYSFASWSDVTDAKASSTNYTSPTFNDYILKSDGYYRIIATIEVSYSPTPAQLDSFCTLNLSFKVTSKGADSIQIGTNGININSGNFNAYVSDKAIELMDYNTSTYSTGIVIREGNNIPLQKTTYYNNYPAGYYPALLTIGNQKRITKTPNIGNSLTLSNDYDLYLFTNSGTNVMNINVSYIPIGRTIWVKSIGGPLTISNSNMPTFLIDSNDTIKRTTVSIGTYMAELSYTGEYWLVQRQVK